MLGRVGQLYVSNYETIKKCTEEMLGAMRQNLEIIEANRRELNGEADPQEMQAARPSQEQSDDDFEFDENAFLDHIDEEE